MKREDKINQVLVQIYNETTDQQVQQNIRNFFYWRYLNMLETKTRISNEEWRDFLIYKAILLAISQYDWNKGCMFHSYLKNKYRYLELDINEEKKERNKVEYSECDNELDIEQFEVSLKDIDLLKSETTLDEVLQYLKTLWEKGEAYYEHIVEKKTKIVISEERKLTPLKVTWMINEVNSLLKARYNWVL